MLRAVLKELRSGRAYDATNRLFHFLQEPVDGLEWPAAITGRHGVPIDVGVFGKAKYNTDPPCITPVCRTNAGLCRATSSW
jgi:hypothetical protein